MKETHENQISFPEINVSGMKVVLDYVENGSVDEKLLSTIENIAKALHVAYYLHSKI